MNSIKWNVLNEIYEESSPHYEKSNERNKSKYTFLHSTVANRGCCFFQFVTTYLLN